MIGASLIFELLLGAGDYSLSNIGLLDGPGGAFCISFGYANPVCVTALG